MNSNCTFLTVISFDSALKKDEKNKIAIRHINDNLIDFSYSSDDSDEE